MRTTALLLIPSFWRLAAAALYTHLDQLPRTEFDFVVVGAGPGGSTVASRLSEDPRVRVLLVEAGPTQERFEPTVQVPWLAPRLAPHTPLDWNYTTAPQAGLGNRSIAYSRGKLLGGTSAINYMAWTRGSAEDYDRLANVTGDEGWSWRALEPFAKRSETLVPPADGHDTAGEVRPQVHGHAGPVGVSVQDWPNHVIPRILAATRELAEFPYNEDMNSGSPLGIGWSQWSVRNGTRVTAATAYITPHLARPNLFVLTNTLATKLIQTGTHDGTPEFKRLALSSLPQGLSRNISATREIVVSGGSINSPHLLLLSGIGPAAHLRAHGIAPRVDLPAVGQNLHDHVLVPLNWAVRTDHSQDDLARNATLFNDTLAQWERERKGVFTSAITQQIGFGRLPANASALRGVPDPAAGPNSPHYELLFSDFFVNPSMPSPTDGHYLSIDVALISVTSRGALTLTSSDPFTHPHVDPKFLSTPLDRAVLRDALRAAYRFAAAPAWKGYVLEPAASPSADASDEELDAYLADNASVNYHLAGSCAAGPGRVLDAKLRVRGAKGVRVVDASIFPFIPSGHMQAPTYMIAERAAQLIKEEHGLA